jgi:hypothetical protein
MRIRFGVGLPGPFHLSSGGSARGGGSVLAVLLVVALCLASWWIAAAVLGFVALVVVCVLHDRARGIPVGRRR